MINNRFTVQILGNVDYSDYGQLQARVMEVLGSIEGFTMTTCNLTAWQDGNGNLRRFDENGTEIVETVREVIDKSDPEMHVTETAIEIVEVTA